MKTKKERVIERAKRTRKLATGSNLSTRYEAVVLGDHVEVREYANDSEVDMLLREYQVAL